jgi:hypothetical protein
MIAYPSLRASWLLALPLLCVLTVRAAAAQPDSTEDLGAAQNAPSESAAVAASSPETGNYEPTEPFDKAARDRKPVKYGHAGQLTVRAAATLPYKVNFRMDDSPGCSNGKVTEDKVCAFASPPALEFALGYAIVDAIEPFAWARIGLLPERVTQTAASKLFGAGLRIYPMTDTRFKLLIEPAVAVEIEGSRLKNPQRAGKPINYGTDILVHLNLGGQFEITRNVGVYVSVGPEVAFLRAISLAVNATLGVQARFF